MGGTELARGIMRSFATTAAGAWLGGMILIAIVAQTTFSEMRATGVEQPNAIAGRVMAKNFVRFDTVQWVLAGTLVVAQIGRIALGERSGVEWLRMVLCLGATGVLAYGALYLTPQIVNMQATAAAPDPDAAVRSIFESFHQTSVRLAKLNLVVVFAIVLSLSWNVRRAPAGDMA
ncbi:MAG: DUF4149 domain-containing protein [Phycisphaerae bacterium]|nr:DUF4149 domain-containing protein [Phycisphaerae bacterium]